LTAGPIMSEAARRICSTRSQQYAKPGRQLITFLLFANITLVSTTPFVMRAGVDNSDGRAVVEAVTQRNYIGHNVGIVSQSQINAFSSCSGSWILS
jgi:hypothetical protein